MNKLQPLNPEFIERMTDAEIVNLMQSGTAIAKARQSFSENCACIEQAYMQREKPSVFVIRKMEFIAVLEIAKIFLNNLLEENNR